MSPYYFFSGNTAANEFLQDTAGFANGYMNRLTNTHQNRYYLAMSPNSFNAGDTAVFEFRQSAIGAASGYGAAFGTGLRPVSK